MIKKIIIALITIIPLYNYAQKDSTKIFEIEYKRILTPSNSTKTITSNYTLKVFTEMNISVFANNNVVNQSNKLIDDEDDDAIFYYTPNGKNTSLIFKDYTKNQLFSKGSIAFKTLTIKDSLSIFDWTINKESKEILGYKCQLAKTNFRGRNYNAWFSIELPVGGPWKYDGLPGLILQIESEDNFISFEAVSIKSNKIKSLDSKNPFEKDKHLTWVEFKDLYKQKAIALSKYSTESGFKGGVVTPRMGIERYIDENDTDYTADKEFEKQQESQTKD